MHGSTFIQHKVIVIMFILECDLTCNEEYILIVQISYIVVLLLRLCLVLTRHFLRQ